MRSQVFWCLLSCLTLTHTKQLYEGDACSLESGATGVCVRQHSCPSIGRQLSRGVRPRICCFHNTEAVVCCATAGTTTPPIVKRRLHSEESAVNQVRRMCELYGAYGVAPDGLVAESTHGISESVSLNRLLESEPRAADGRSGLSSKEVGFRIVGGEVTEEGEFPHMAALGWGEEADIKWLCGGSLISERFVLTAAHCLQAQGRGLVRWVRLGTDVANVTTDHTQLLAVKNIHRHENYTLASYYHDIALLELRQDVPLGYYVRPACLHTKFVGPDDGAVTATGWGALNSSVADSLVLMKVDLQFQRLEVCNSTYALLARTRRLSRGISDETMICVGDLQESKDTCQGDSGGPIQVPLSQPQNMHSIVGVTSFGVMGCGQARSPAIYTRVSHYVPWIVNIVWPNI